MNTRTSFLYTSNLFSLLILIFTFLFSNTVNAQQYDQKVASKYGLTVPSPNDKLGPVPQWFQDANMVTSKHGGVFLDYKFTLKDTAMTRIVRRRAGNGPAMITEQYLVETIGSFDGSPIKGVPLISHVPHYKMAFNEAHKQGFKVISYLHFRDIHSYYADQDVFLFQHPEILITDKDGKWSHLLMDGTQRFYRYRTCANSPSYWKLSLDYVKKMMDWGADGIFIDNVSGRGSVECHAGGFENSPSNRLRNPEFAPYTHDHLFDANQEYAWARMLQAIRALVKTYGDDKVVVLNYSGPNNDILNQGDGGMKEGFLFSWVSKGRHGTWEDVKKGAQGYQDYLSSGRRITALSYLNASSKEAKDDAFWTFSSANLVDFVLWATLNGTGAESLYQVRLGKGEPIKEANKIVSRAYENGFIVLNDGTEDQHIELTLPRNLKKDHLLDIYNDSQNIKINRGKVKVFVPAKMARVYTFN